MNKRSFCIKTIINSQNDELNLDKIKCIYQLDSWNYLLGALGPTSLSNYFIEQIPDKSLSVYFYLIGIPEEIGIKQKSMWVKISHDKSYNFYFETGYFDKQEFHTIKININELGIRTLLNLARINTESNLSLQFKEMGDKTFGWIDVFLFLGGKIASFAWDESINYLKKNVLHEPDKLENMIIEFRDFIRSALTETKIREISGIIKDGTTQYKDYYLLLEDYLGGGYGSQIPPETLRIAKNKLERAGALLDQVISQIEMLAGIDGFANYLVATPIDLRIKNERIKYIPDYDAIYRSRISRYLGNFYTLFDKWPTKVEFLWPEGVPYNRRQIHEKCNEYYSQEIEPCESTLEKWALSTDFTYPYLHSFFRVRDGRYLTACDSMGDFTLDLWSNYQMGNRDQLFLVKSLERHDPIQLSPTHSYNPIHNNDKITIQLRTREFINCEGRVSLNVNHEILNILKIRGSQGDLINAGDFVVFKTKNNQYLSYSSLPVHEYVLYNPDVSTSKQVFRMTFYI